MTLGYDRPTSDKMSGEAFGDTRLTTAYRLLERGDITVLSFDVFDTLLWRIVPEPVDAFVLLGHRLRERGALRAYVAPQFFAELRERTERRVRAAAQAAGRGPEIDLAEIYRHLPPHVFYDIHPDALVELEVEVERNITFPDIEMVRLAEVAQHDLGIRVVLASDTYYTVEHLRQLLDRDAFGEITFEHIFTSSQYGTGKGTGLYRLMLTTLDVEPGHILHIGDNWDADIKQARAEGITAVHVEKLPKPLKAVVASEDLQGRSGARSHQKPRLDPEWGDFGLTALRAKALSRADDNGHYPASNGDEGGTGVDVERRGDIANPYWRFGVSVPGPVFTAFAEWVHHRAQEEGVDRVYCLMREGAFLARLIDNAGAYLGSPVRAETLWLSRQVCARASIFEATAEELSGFFSRRLAPTVRQLCATLGIELRQLPELHTEADSLLDNPELAQRLIECVTNRPEVRAAVMANAAALRSRLVDYLLRSIQPTHGRIMLVDLGWAGTIQAGLDTALSQAGASLRTIGLYLLTSARVLDYTSDGLWAEGFLANGGMPVDAAWITRSPEILEQVCMPDEGSLIDIADDGRPVLSPPDLRQGPAQTRQRHAVQRGILSFQQEWDRNGEIIPAEARNLLDERARPQLLRMLTRFIVSPTAEEAALFSGWLHDQNFGGTAAEEIAPAGLAPMLSYLSPQQFLDLPMTKLYWPFGLAALHDRPLALTAGALVDDVLPPEALTPMRPCEVQVLVDIGGGFAPVTSRTTGPNVNGLCYLRAEIQGRPLRGLLLRFGDHPAALRLDWIRLVFGLEGRSEPEIVTIEAPEDFQTLSYRNGVPLNDNLVLTSNLPPEVVFCCPPAWGDIAYKVEIETGFAWMPTSAQRGRTPTNAEVLLHLARRVKGKARNLWLSSSQSATDAPSRRRPLPRSRS